MIVEELGLVYFDLFDLQMDCSRDAIFDELCGASPLSSTGFGQQTSPKSFQHKDSPHLLTYLRHKPILKTIKKQHLIIIRTFI